MSRDEDQLAEWMRLANSGDQLAYRDFLNSVSGIVRSVIRSKAGGLPIDEQEEILQEVLLAIHQKRATWRQDHPIKPWFYAIARYKIVDVFRARGRAQFVDIDDFSNVLSVEEPEAGQGLDAETLVARLPNKQQKVVRMISMQGMSIDDVSRELDMSPVAVRVNFHRALERLRSFAQETDA